MKAPQKFLVVILLLISLVGNSSIQPVSANILDEIPISSQLKSLWQWITGDAESTRTTQVNSTDQAPIFLQLRSAEEIATRRPEGAKKRLDYFAATVEGLVETTPVLGHVIGSVYVASGDKEHGLEVIKGASSSTGAWVGGLVGGTVGGPGGAFAGSLAGEYVVHLIITAADSSINKEFRPYGSIDYVANIKNKSSGDHADQIIGLGLSVLRGPASKIKPRPNKKGPKSRPIGGKINDESYGSTNVLDERVEKFPESNLDLSDKTIGLHPSPKMASDEKKHTQSSIDDKLRIEHKVGSLSGRTIEQVRAMSDKEKLAILRESLKHLPESHRLKLRPIDFKDVKFFVGKYKCYLCEIAGGAEKMIRRQARDWPEAIDNKLENADSNRGRPPVVSKLFKDTKLSSARAIFMDDKLTMHHWLTRKLSTMKRQAIFEFALRFDWANYKFGRTLMGRAWLEEGQLKTLYTDYQVIPENQLDRYTDHEPEGIRNRMLIDLSNKIDGVPMTRYDPNADSSAMSPGESYDNLADGLDKNVRGFFAHGGGISMVLTCERFVCIRPTGV